MSRGKQDYRFFHQKRQSKLSSQKQLPKNEYTLMNLGIKKITIDTKYSLMPVFTRFIYDNMMMKKRPFWSPINGSKQGLIHLHILFLGIVHFALFKINDFAPEHFVYSNSWAERFIWLFSGTHLYVLFSIFILFCIFVYLI